MLYKSHGTSQKQALCTKMLPDQPFPHNSPAWCNFCLIGTFYANEVEKQPTRLPGTWRWCSADCVCACLRTAAKGEARAGELEVLSTLQFLSAAHQEQLLAWPCPLCYMHKGPPKTLDPAPTFKSHELGVNKPKRRDGHKKGPSQELLHVMRANLIVPKPPRSSWFHPAPLNIPWNNGVQTIWGETIAAATC